MENFVVSARKYRPLEFDAVVGQSHITNTLEHAIDNNQLAQALLFCGPRGVGKTTCARILARKINEKYGETDENDFAFNIFELDAASNNSVDDIRNLIEQVRYAPQVGKYKVYIIDEVHMLSNAAFNAFLKTLEEPPAHAIFILATTEKQKIIPTILSRCQIYDFKRIEVNDINNHLKKIAQEEGIQYEEDALYIIAQKADGGLRDALSMFDRLVTFTQKNLTVASVTENLSILDYEYYFKITDLALKNDIPGLLLAFNDIIKKGFDPQLFISGLGSHFRDLMVAQNPQTISLLEVGDNTKQKYLQQAQNCSSRFLIDAIEICHQADINFRNSKSPKLSIEIALMQLASLTAGESPTTKKKKFRIIPPPNHLPAKQENKLSPQTIKSEEEKQIEKVGNSQVKVENNLPSKPIVKSGIPLGNQTKKGSFLSIKGSLHTASQKEEKVANLDFSERDKDDFTEDQVKSFWNTYLETLKNQPVLYSVLNTTQCSVKPNHTIFFEFPSNSAYDEFEHLREDIFQKLKKEVNNYSINFKYQIKETQRTILLTDKDKYEKMVKENPLLEKLRNDFRLDF